MWLDCDRLNELSQTSGGPSKVQFEQRDLIAGLFDRGPCDPMRIESLAVFLAAHFLEVYRGVPAISGERVRSLEQAKLGRVTDYIAANLDQPIDLRALAGLTGQSPFHFAKSFRATAGVPPYTFVTDRRMEGAMVLLRTTRLPVRNVAERVGFSSLSHFLNQFRRAWGQNPHTFRADRRN